VGQPGDALKARRQHPGGAGPDAEVEKNSIRPGSAQKELRTRKRAEILLGACRPDAEVEKNSIRPGSAQKELRTRKRTEILLSRRALAGRMRNWNRRSIEQI